MSSSAKKKKGTFASRAHSFKENFLDAIKNGQVPSPQRKQRPQKNSIVLAKKTNSTDNLTVTGHLGTAKTTDCLIKDVQFALKYFQDVVTKQTYEMLPGCATVVLETVLAIKAFASNIEGSEDDPELDQALQHAFKTVSVLTSWADSVIVRGGEVETDHSSADSIIEPVRRSVIVAVNCISVRLGNKSLARGNSLPDITNDDCPDFGAEVDLSQSSDSLLNHGAKPPLFPKQSDSRYEEAPPLPPKHLKPKLEKFEDLLAHSFSLHSMDWSPGQADSQVRFPRYELNRPRQSLVKRTQQVNTHNLDRSLPSPKGLDTTLTDQSFEYSYDTNSSPTSLSKESLTNMSLDETDFSTQKMNLLSLAGRSWSPSSAQSDPPVLPRKSRAGQQVPPSATKSQGRKLSQYDNVADAESLNLRRQYELRLRDQSQSHHPHITNPDLQRASSSPLTLSKTPVSRTRSLNKPPLMEMSEEIPPPLPPKKRNIMSYMEMFGKSIFPTGDDLFQGFLQSHDVLHNVWQHNFHEYTDYTPGAATGLQLNFPFIDQQQAPEQALHPYINMQLVQSEQPPALPPKRSNLSISRPGSFRSSSSGEGERKIPIIVEDRAAGNRNSQFSDSGSSSSSEVPRLAEITKLPRLTVQIPIQRLDKKECKESPLAAESSLLDETDVSEFLVYGEQSNNNNNSGLSSGSVELRAGTVDALIVLATQTIKNDFLYQEAFLSTYRTFIQTEILIDKLVYRFTKFAKLSKKQNNAISCLRISRNAFSLLVRVVDGLSDVDFLNKSLLEKLTKFITSLVETGELGLARALRSQFILKYEDRRARLLPDFDLASLNSINRRTSLLNFKSLEIAEQMTYLDSQLFLRLDSAELLIWVQEQSEEKSLNLTKFTEHFNNMSYWTRTLILQQPDAKERERYLMKFIKIMKWLRKMNNFNSYLAILSALDSAPVRRLEWQKNITDGLKEYCSLIDSSSSFRAYRQALAESSPPCIPYIGLILQDLTFVQIGNQDFLDEKINFAKRWQQFNILDNLQRFKKEQYNINRNEDLILFFGDFEEYLTEDEMWNLSETIKPRGTGNKTNK